MASIRPTPQSVQIHIPLPPGWPTPLEFAWAIPLGRTLYQVIGPCLFATGVHHDDVVRCRPTRRGPRYHSTVLPSGHHTIRLFAPGHTSPPLTHPLFRRLQDLTCEPVWGANGLVALDIPPGDILPLVLFELDGQHDVLWEGFENLTHARLQ